MGLELGLVRCVTIGIRAECAPFSFGDEIRYAKCFDAFRSAVNQIGKQTHTQDKITVNLYLLTHTHTHG